MKKGFTPSEIRSLTGFTLIELTIASAILAMTLLGVLAFYQDTLILGQYAQGRTLALQSVQAKLEEMRRNPYGSLTTNYGVGGTPGNTFIPTGLNGRGAITFDTTNPAAIGVRVTVSWQERGRMFGEDRDLDGALDAGEDTNGNGLLDGPVELVTYLADEETS